MSQPNKELNKSLFTVILCAGEGVRLQEFTRTLPKPLIKIKALNNRSILQNTIYLLVSMGLKKIAIVKGYLADRIDDFIAGLKQEDPDLQNILFLADAKPQYQLGPLYSFLSITKNKDLFQSRYIYLIIPGDTIFQYNLLNEILWFIKNNLDRIQNIPLVFFRKIHGDFLKERYQSKKISLAYVERRDIQFFLKKIKQASLSEISNSETINQMIPTFLFPYNFIQEIINVEKKKSVKTIREMVNYLVEQGKKIIAVELSSDYDFYDIDTRLDLIELNKKRGTIVKSEY